MFPAGMKVFCHYTKPSQHHCCSKHMPTLLRLEFSAHHRKCATGVVYGAWRFVVAAIDIVRARAPRLVQRNEWGARDDDIWRSSSSCSTSLIDAGPRMPNRDSHRAHHRTHRTDRTETRARRTRARTHSLCNELPMHTAYTMGRRVARDAKTYAPAC